MKNHFTSPSRDGLRPRRPLLLIDLDHTLVERDGGADAWTPGFCAAHGLPAEAAPTVFALLRADRSPAGFARIADHYGLPRSGATLWEEHVAQEAARTHLIPGVPEALAALRDAGWTIAVVTNGSTDIQRAKLARTGLLPAVDAVCVSEEAGARKPAPAIFHLAATRLGRTLTAADWMVGNNPATDLRGAHATGLRSVWITPTPPPPLPPAHPTPTHTAPDTPAAATLLLTLRPTRSPGPS
ncbi:HAD family hydrolase [Streptomyces sp. BE20]|uniref:HAD family hydrolase n=1 Tax=Streptomyces sp. BE20 TaxID=3002525 RepID=UPI002E78BB27|nr:HAD family hydrolase [Streptomyces sp. BE20]MEE1828968.1 HAD family hydrolase [Streptomyces sp. BE20]